MDQPTISRAEERRFSRLYQRDGGGTLRRWRIAEPVDVEGVRWVCAQALRPQDVFGLVYDLSRAGFRAYAPETVRIVRRPRVGGSRPRLPRIRCEPVFGTYLFVGQPAGLRLAKSSHRRLAGVLGAGAGEFSAIPPSIIAGFVETELAGGWDERTAEASALAAAAFAVGKLVRIVEGPFEGFYGTVEGADAIRGIVRLGISRAVVKIEACNLEFA